MTTRATTSRTGFKTRVRLFQYFFSFLTIPFFATGADTTINLVALAEDSTINSSGNSPWIGDRQVRIGRGDNDGTTADYVIPFQLPELNGDVVKNAILTVSIPQGSYDAASLGNVDLYGSSILGATPSVDDVDFYINAANPQNQQSVLLQDDFVETASHVGDRFGLVSSVDISEYLTWLYDSGAQAGDYTYLILSLDAEPTKNYRFLVADSANSSQKPNLKLVVGTDYGALTEGQEVAENRTIELLPPSEDNNVNIDGSGQFIKDSQVQIGRRNNDGTSYDYVIPFQLPDLQGAAIKDAQLKVSVPRGSYDAVNLGNIDLYGSSILSSSPSVANSDFYVKSTGGVNNQVMLLQDDFIETASHIQNGNTSVTSVDIGGFLTWLYNAGAQPGEFAFLILSLDRTPESNYRYLVADSAESSSPPSLEMNLGAEFSPNTVLVLSDTGDRTLRNTGETEWVNESAIRIGRRNSDGQNWSFVMPFALPDLENANISSAEFAVNFTTAGSYDAANLGNVDLYGLTVTRSSSNTNSTDFFVDGTNPTNPNAKLIQDNFIDSAELVADGYGFVKSANLSEFIQACYDGGGQPGDYVFLVLTLDSDPGRNHRFLTLNTGNSTNQPSLLITADAPPSGFFCDPENGDISNNGTAVSPWPDLASTLAAGITIPDGATVWLTNGFHGDVTLSGHNAENTTIAALQGHQPIFKRIVVRDGSNWTLQGLEITTEGFDLTGVRYMLHIQRTSHTVAVNRCLLYSFADATNLTGQDWSDLSVDGIRVDGPDCSISNNSILNSKIGIAAIGSAPNTYVGFNTVDAFSGDGMRGLGDNCVFEFNLVQNAKNVDGNHDDGFQSFAGTDADGVVSDVVLRGNVFISFTDANQPLKSKMQGIGCFDGFYDNWLIENNVVFSDTFNGIALSGARNCKIVNNSVLENPIDAFDPLPWISVRPHRDGTPSTGNIVANNITQTILGLTFSSASVENNIVTRDYDEHFANWRDFDVQLRASSPAIDAADPSLSATVDFQGNARDSQPDIGADEF